MDGFAGFLRRGLRLDAVFAVLLMVLFLIPSGADAQTFRFTSFDVQGNQRVAEATVLNFASIPRNETVTAGQLNDALQRLQNSTLFETVEVVPRGNQLVIIVQEYPTINRINIEGNRRLDDEDLLPLLASQPRRAYSPATAEADAAEITEAYRLQGRLTATVTPQIIRRSQNRVDLVFEVTEGRVTETERIAFVGNRAYSDRRLRRVLESTQAGFFRTFIRSDTFVADRIEFDRQLLTDFYRERGYIDFTVQSSTSELTRARDAYFVTFNIREGQSFRIGEITTTTDLPNIDPDQFHAVLRLRPGVTYSPRLIDNQITRMENLATQMGLRFIRIEPVLTRNDEDLTLDIEFQVTRGERVFVERIDIEGNATTMDRVIRRQFRTAEGDPLDPREIRNGAERVRALGFFADAQVAARPGSTEDQVIVDVDVEEALEPIGMKRVLDQVNKLPSGPALSFLVLRSLTQAIYDTGNVGHFGLASKEYLHFTSPIRRYPDLLVHRLMKMQLHKEGKASGGGGKWKRPLKDELQELAAACSSHERRAVEAEREAVAMYRAYVMREHVGEEFEGRVTGVTHFGAFVEIDAPFVEGLVKLDSLGDDQFEFDPVLLKLSGRRTGFTVSLGDTVQVVVQNCLLYTSPSPRDRG